MINEAIQQENIIVPNSWQNCRQSKQTEGGVCTLINKIRDENGDNTVDTRENHKSSVHVIKSYMLGLERYLSS